MRESLGTIEFAAGSLTVTDPCYDEGDNGIAVVENAFKGEWEAFVEIVAPRSVAALEVKAVGQVAVRTKKLPERISVDAGVCGVFERKPNYVYDCEKGIDEWGQVCDAMGWRSYGLADKASAFRCVGAWSSSGCGDGECDAYVSYDANGEAVGIRIEYLANAD